MLHNLKVSRYNPEKGILPSGLVSLCPPRNRSGLHHCLGSLRVKALAFIHCKKEDQAEASQAIPQIGGSYVQ